MTKAEKEDNNSEAPVERETWGSRLDFLLSVVAFSVGLGNVWRFPYLCYKNGGGVFFIPYLTMLLLGGIPTFFLEVSLGQYMSQGGITAWQITPIFKGIGVATIVIVFYLNIYYIVVLAWDIFYLFMSFQKELPWSHCGNSWNTANCSVSSRDVTYNETSANSTGCLGNLTCISIAGFKPVDPVIEFWERRVLQISDGIDSPDGFVWELVLTLFIVWVMVYFCVWRGVSWGGKVAYFTATFPYVLLTILLIRGLTLPGAFDGLTFYLKPDFSKLMGSQVWLDAGTQIFFSYAIGLGAMIALGSYNKFDNNCYKDCLMISCLNSATSVFAGCVIFSVLGFMARDQGVSIHEVAEKGPGLAFIAYPKAVSQMPLPQLWAVLFFFMIILLGLGSQFVGVESFTTVMLDGFPSLRKQGRRELSIAVYCFVSFLCGLPMVTRGGMYVFQLFDYYSASGMALLWVSFFESFAVAWIYGIGRYYDNIEQMVGFRIGVYMKACWMVLTPCVTGVIFIWMWAEFNLLTYNETYVYPWWAQAFGLSLAFSSMICVPAYFLFKLLTSPGNSIKEKWTYASTPRIQVERIPEHWPDHEALVKFNSLPERSALDSLFKHKHYEVNANHDVNVALMDSKPGQNKNVV